MDDPLADPDKLAIRCPGCGQRFKVGLELQDRMVECGTCENRFRVNDEVVIRNKKFYPGERKSPGLDGFARVPKSTKSPVASFQTVEYAEEPAQRAIEPTSPLRLILGFAAIIVALLVAFMLIAGGSVGGVLYGASQSKRLMLAGFTAIVCGALMVAANPRARGKAILGAIATALGLLSLPFVFTDGIHTAGPVVLDDRADEGDVIESPGQTSDEKLEELKRAIGYAPLERELAKSADSAGIWLRDLQEYHKLQVRDYIVRSTGADPSSHMYPRSPDYLLVVSGASADLDELARLCERFGEVRRTVDPLRVIEVAVNNESFQEGPIDKMADPSNPAFYELNRRELESIDLQRAHRAVVRLVGAEPKIYRKDIVRRMQQLLKEGDVPLQKDIGTTLLTWSEPGDGSEAAVRAAVEKIKEERGRVPESLVKFLVSRKDPAVIPIVDEFWAREADVWEEYYGELGTPIEDLVLARFDGAKVTLQMSAVRLLGKVGTAKSIPVLEAALPDAIPELQVLIERALESIRARQ